MTKTEAIDIIEPLVAQVFKAAGELEPVWKPRLAECKFNPKQDAERLASDYCRAVAAKVVYGWSDEQLNEFADGYNKD